MVTAGIIVAAAIVARWRMMLLVFARQSGPAARGGDPSGAVVGRGRRGAGGGVGRRKRNGGEGTIATEQAIIIVIRGDR